MNRLIRNLPAILAGAMVALSCAQQQPVLYPNAHLKAVGTEIAAADIDDCIQLAIDYGAREDAGKKIAKNTAAGAAVGGAAGAAVGGAAGTAVGAVHGNAATGADTGIWYPYRIILA